MLVATPAGRAVAAAGLADRERGARMRGDERVRVGSITKTFTAALILLLPRAGHAVVALSRRAFPAAAGG